MGILPLKLQEGWLRVFLKYFAAGVLGLLLQLAFPRLPVEWSALVLAYALLELAWVPTLLLAAVLSWVYSAFSLSPWWQIFLPWSLALSLFQVSRRSFAFRRRASLALLIFFLVAFTFLSQDLPHWLRFQQTLLAPEDLAVLLVSWAVGLWLLPQALALLKRITSGFFGKIFAARSLPTHGAWNTRVRARKPFGLEKGI